VAATLILSGFSLEEHHHGRPEDERRSSAAWNQGSCGRAGQATAAGVQRALISQDGKQGVPLQFPILTRIPDLVG